MLNKKNILLVKDDVGKAKPCTVKLPPQDFAFGKADIKDQAGVGVITSSWLQHNKSKGIQPVKDFRRMNKATAANKVSLRVSYKNNDHSFMINIGCIFVRQVHHGYEKALSATAEKRQQTHE